MLLKTVHLPALMAGGATGIGNAMLLSKLIAGRQPPPDMVASHMRILGRIGRWAIVVLWLTGLAMAFWAHGTLALGWVFYIKLAAASVMLVAIMWIGRLAAAAARDGRPPDLARMKMLSSTASAGAVVAVLAAVVVFN